MPQHRPRSSGRYAADPADLTATGGSAAADPTDKDGGFSPISLTGPGSFSPAAACKSQVLAMVRGET